MSSKSSRRRTGSATEAPSNAKEADSKGAQYHCDYCRKDISNVVRIRCAECPDFDLCLECFAVGVEVFPHKSDHKYRVIDHVTTPIFEEEWGADEELLLLEAIEMYGLGNWSDVADHVGTKKKEKCEQHYYEVYLNSKTAPLPDVNAPLLQSGKKEEDSSVARAALAEREKLDNAAANVPRPTGPLAAVVGYLPHRNDFETEWDNDAEVVLADMEFRPEDTAVERELKLKVLQIYNNKLDGRAERKRFILERGLLEAQEKKRTKEEKEIEEQMKVFARFHSKEEHEAFVEGLINEHRLRKRIEMLQHYRMQGIRSLKDAEAYEIERGKKEALESLLKQKEAVSFLLDPQTVLDAAASAKRKSDEPSADGANKKPKPAPDQLLDLTNCEGVEMLSPNERQLCSELRLTPKYYFQMKDLVIREGVSKGLIQRAQTKQLIRMDINKTSKLVDFFVSVGWVNAEPDVDPTLSAGTTAGSVVPPFTQADMQSSSSGAFPSGAPPASSSGPNPVTVKPAL